MCIKNIFIIGMIVYICYNENKFVKKEKLKDEKF